MSPPTVAGAVAASGDIYALGIHLYALLTGHEPFPGASSEEVVTTQISDGLPVPNLMVVQAPPPVVRTLKRMMHPDPARRFATVVEVVDELARLEAP